VGSRQEWRDEQEKLRERDRSAWEEARRNEARRLRAVRTGVKLRRGPSPGSFLATLFPRRGEGEGRALHRSLRDAGEWHG
jgi:hypothetical protein